MTKNTGRRWRWVSRPWIIWYAVGLHMLWGSLLLVSPSGYGVTALHVFQNLPRDLMAGILFAASGLAVWAVMRSRPSLKTLAALLPQQALLTLSAYAAVAAIVAAHYGDGVMRPRIFILADQAPAIIAFALHTMAVIETHARRPDGELQRLIRLLRERGSAEIQDILVTLAGMTTKQDSAQRGEQPRAVLARRKSKDGPAGQQPKATDESLV